MNDKLISILDESKLSEPEIVDFLYSYTKFIEVGILTKESFSEILSTLNIEWDGKNKFKLSETVEYTFN